MKLQVALDTFSLETAVAVLERIAPWVDVAEIGTGLGISAGIEAVRVIKEAHPQLEVLSDIKIMDGGESMAAFVLDGGADIVSVLGVTDDATVAAAVGAAHERGKRVLCDMIGVRDVATRAAELDSLGVDLVCVHTPYDLRETVKPPAEALVQVKAAVTRAGTVVTGGIKLDTVDSIVALAPDVVVVGSGIMAAADPEAAAKAFHRAVHAA
ncbi:orotidine 5'-phosphate decarboxylase [Actinotalea sp. M2MS4P-6]|uniref:3-hexulose-6-phosphate synthase n=1 Tax=Actinotalea sp. M2MS4P-6 TaxID=2983762 RepID=UPI0021E46D4B|nr:3-hexulose-6-phosphate synthase [Actinotalea sp. M2MS4P-6]MCV2395138.1 orotidine 5'-phosphate decarboxylase [Actinotalea sp. M2MS4P-6]